MFADAHELEEMLKGNLILFNEVCSRIYNKAVEDAMRATPELTARLIKSSITIKSMIEDFRKDHPEFKGHDELVARVVQEVEAENPGANYDDILKKSAPKILNAIKADAIEPVQGQMSLLDLNNKLFQ